MSSFIFHVDYISDSCIRSWCTQISVPLPIFMREMPMLYSQSVRQTDWAFCFLEREYISYFNVIVSTVNIFIQSVRSINFDDSSGVIFSISP